MRKIPTITMSRQILGTAIIHWLSLRFDYPFLPYRVIGSTVIPPSRFRVELLPKPLKKKAYPDLVKHPPYFPSEERFTLTRHELKCALTRELQLSHWRVKYEGNLIKTLPTWMPSTISVCIGIFPRECKYRRGPRHLWRPLRKT